MNSMNVNVTGRMEQRDEIAKMHEMVTDIKVDVSFFIAGKKVEYRNISKIAVEKNGAQALKRNRKKANVMFDKILEKTIVLENDSDNVEEKKHEERLSGVIECIQLYPGEKKFYDAILNDILRADQVEFYEFIQYWKMAQMFPNLTPRRRIQAGK